MQAAHASMDAIDELQGGGAVRAQRGDLPNSVGVEQTTGALLVTDVEKKILSKRMAGAPTKKKTRIPSL